MSPGTLSEAFESCRHLILAWRDEKTSSGTVSHSLPVPTVNPTLVHRAMSRLRVHGILRLRNADIGTIVDAYQSSRSGSWRLSIAKSPRQ